MLAAVAGLTTWAGIKAKLSWYIESRPRRIRDAWRALPSPFYIEVISAKIMLFWAWVASANGVLANQENYAVLRNVIAPDTLVYIATIVALFQAVMLYYKSRWGRVCATVLSGVFWGFLGLGIYYARGPVPGITSYVGYVEMNFFAFVLLLRRRRETL